MTVIVDKYTGVTEAEYVEQIQSGRKVGVSWWGGDLLTCWALSRSRHGCWDNRRSYAETTRNAGENHYNTVNTPRCTHTDTHTDTHLDTHRGTEQTHRADTTQETTCTQARSVQQQQQEQQQPFYGPLSGTTQLSWYQKKHSSTHHPDHHRIFINFFHLPHLKIIP